MFASSWSYFETNSEPWSVTFKSGTYECTRKVAIVSADIENKKYKVEWKHVLNCFANVYAVAVLLERKMLHLCSLLTQ